MQPKEGDVMFPVMNRTLFSEGLIIVEGKSDACVCAHVGFCIK